ncbi:GNAT family N-acetyltransferase [Paeniglutamicibacter cryotolerans]|uniref:N-acetyltransferase domain-containing protein n=1 Tax=Paeniglutamicibacter cryotolerans TaxID=670079 RepID=A0A839QLH9_9MICC|nr:GNAT family N-acetyltransferase [Paeniglutamicibacter cryotolerans]MBB2994866.1 hypothetical protein [Paeniglutamicibacter cryotolerans]
MSGIRMHHAEERRRYDLLDGDAVIGSAHYRELFETAADGTARVERIFFQTLVDDAYSGQGLAGRLTAFALSDSVASGTRIVAVCPYIKAYLAKHDAFDGNVIPVRPDHLDALPQE